MSDYLVLARKYRPKTFKEVIGQDATVQTLKNAIKKNCMAHAYLFCGSRGTGKTTLARIVAKAINCENLSPDCEPCNSCASCVHIQSGASLDVLEIDGASNRGIEDIKTLADSVGYCPAHGKWKVYIIDEVHMLTKEAFNALLKTLEEPPLHVKFLFATTEVHKIPATIVSRCQRFVLKRHTLEAITKKLQMIAKELALSVDEAALYRIAQFSEGGLRDAESLFDQIIAFSNGKITQEVVQNVLGLMSEDIFHSLDRAVASCDVAVAFRIAEELFMQGKDLYYFLEDLYRHFKAHLFKILKKDGLEYTQEQILAILEMITTAQNTIKTTISQQIALEGLLVKVIRIRSHIPIEELVKELTSIQQELTRLQETGIQETGIQERQIQDTRIQDTRIQEIPVATTAPLPAPVPVAVDLPPAQEGTMSTMRKKARYDTLVQFAAVELEASLQRKPKPI